jgi:hypothetical protein
MSTFILASESPEEIRRYALETAPAVREAVARARNPREAQPEPARVSVDGARGSGLDESTRPVGPPPDPDLELTAADRARGQHLVEVHDYLRAELDQLRELMDRVLDGALDPAAARSHINTMTMRQNNWTLGTYCESFCRVLTTHHTLEDVGMLPQLRQADPRLAPVLDRLAEEHVSIHGVIEELDRALVAFVGDPGATAPLRAAIDLLTASLRSHLSYEERELVEPLSRIPLH